MRQHARVCLVAILLAWLAPVAAHADGGAALPVHVGTHPGYGRVVFDLPERLDFHLTQQGQQVQVQFTGNVTIGAAPAMPHNVLGLTGSAGQAELVVVEGTVARAWRLGNRLVIDVLDPAVAASIPSAPVQFLRLRQTRALSFSSRPSTFRREALTALLRQRRSLGPFLPHPVRHHHRPARSLAMSSPDIRPSSRSSSACLSSHFSG